MALRLDRNEESVTKIKVIGIGGGGNNTIDRMIESNLKSAEFIAVNTDMQQLNRSKADIKLQIGAKTCAGKGCGANPAVGRRAAEENKEDLARLLTGADMVFITAGMGGGTGTGAAPVVAAMAREMGILTVGVVTRPFKFEGGRRIAQAEAGIAQLHENVDSLVIIPNERLKYVTDQKITFLNAFAFADDVLKQAISSIYELIVMRGLISLDFADVAAIMKDGGYAHMGVGRAAGSNKALEAARMATQSPLLETSINGAKGILMNIIGSPEMQLEEVDAAATFVQENVNPDATIIFGAAIDTALSDEMRITIIATGFEDCAPNPLPEVGKKKEPHKEESGDLDLIFSKTAGGDSAAAQSYDELMKLLGR